MVQRPVLLASFLPAVYQQRTSKAFLGSSGVLCTDKTQGVHSIPWGKHSWKVILKVYVNRYRKKERQRQIQIPGGTFWSSKALRVCAHVWVPHDEVGHCAEVSMHTPTQSKQKVRWIFKWPLLNNAALTASSRSAPAEEFFSQAFFHAAWCHLPRWKIPNVALGVDVRGVWGTGSLFLVIRNH